MPVIKGGRADQQVAPDEHGRRGAKALAGEAAVLRRTSLALMVLLVVQSGIGIVVNLGVTIPAADSGAGIGPAVGRAISSGPPSLAIHAVLGLALIAAAVFLVVRAALAGDRAVVVTAVAGLVSLTEAAHQRGELCGQRSQQRVGDDGHAWPAWPLVSYAASFYLLGRR